MDLKEFAEEVHMEIHAVRRIPNYKPSQMEKNISKLVLNTFTNCKECKEVKEKIKNQPEKKGISNKLSEILGG